MKKTPYQKPLLHHSWPDVRMTRLNHTRTFVQWWAYALHITCFCSSCSRSAHIVSHYSTDHDI